MDRCRHAGLRSDVDHRLHGRQAAAAGSLRMTVQARNEPSNDRPQVAVLPQLIPLATVVLSIAMQLLLPLHQFARLTGYLRFPAGALLLAAGIFLVASGRHALTSNGTHVQTSLPTRVLVKQGVFRWTRNPLYVGGCLAMVGMAFAACLDWLPPILALSLPLLHFGVIKREEHYLGQKFGDDYRRYVSRVPRYLPRIGTIVARARLNGENDQRSRQQGHGYE